MHVNVWEPSPCHNSRAVPQCVEEKQWSSHSVKKMNNSVYEFIISLFWGINHSILTCLFFVFVFFPHLLLNLALNLLILLVLVVRCFLTEDCCTFSVCSLNREEMGVCKNKPIFPYPLKALICSQILCHICTGHLNTKTRLCSHCFYPFIWIQTIAEDRSPSTPVAAA